LDSASQSAAPRDSAPAASGGFVPLLALRVLTVLNDNLLRWLVIGLGKRAAGTAGTALVLTIGTAGFVLPFVALAWLAVRGVVYTDLRGPNVLLEGTSEPQLVDFDDCVVVEGGVRSVRGFKAALADFGRVEGLWGGFAVSCAGGRFPELERALGAAFAALGGGEGEGEAEGGGAGSKRARC
jgi:hypothetical protein